MKQSSEYDRYYDDAWFYVWEVTTGQSVNHQECYEAAKYFAKFANQELDRHHDLTAKGETAIVRRGLVSAPYLVRSWVFNVIEDCSDLAAPIPSELLDVLYRVLECNHLQNDEKVERLKFVRDQVRAQLDMDQFRGVRVTAREFGVDPSTVSRWINRGISNDELFDQNKWKQVIKRTKIFDFSRGIPRPILSPDNTKGDS